MIFKKSFIKAARIATIILVALGIGLIVLLILAYAIWEAWKAKPEAVIGIGMVTSIIVGSGLVYGTWQEVRYRRKYKKDPNGGKPGLVTGFAPASKKR